MRVDCLDFVVLFFLENGRLSDFFGLFNFIGGLEVGDIGIFINKDIKGFGRLFGKIKKYDCIRI